MMRFVPTAAQINWEVGDVIVLCAPAVPFNVQVEARDTSFSSFDMNLFAGSM